MQPQLFTTQQTELTSDDYYTPKWIFDALGLHFDLDVASPPHPTHVPCDRYLTQADDGLTADWYGRVWMNPPFSRPAPWIHRWLDHGNGVCVIIISKSHAFQRLWRNPNVGVAYLCDQGSAGVKFVRDGISNQMPYPVCIAAIGTDNIAALHNIGHVR